MIFYIFSNHFCRHLVPNRSSKISIFPKFPTPKLFLYLRVLLKYYTRTDTLQHPYYLGNTISRWKRQEIYEHDLLLPPAYLSQNHDSWLSPQNTSLTRSLISSSQYPLSIFRSPYQMILRIIYRMTGSLQFHALTITHFSLPSAGELFIPVYKTGYSSSDFA